MSNFRRILNLYIWTKLLEHTVYIWTSLTSQKKTLQSYKSVEKHIFNLLKACVAPKYADNFGSPSVWCVAILQWEITSAIAYICIGKVAWFAVIYETLRILRTQSVSKSWNKNTSITLFFYMIIIHMNSKELKWLICSQRPCVG